jgi:hypothetical protein
VLVKQNGLPPMRQGLVAIFLKGRTSRPWAKPRVGKAKRSAAHAPGIAAESPQALHGAGRDFAEQNRCTPMQPGKAEDLKRKARFWRGAPKGAQILNPLSTPNF